MHVWTYCYGIRSLTYYIWYFCMIFLTSVLLQKFKFFVYLKLEFVQIDYYILSLLRIYAFLVSTNSKQVQLTARQALILSTSNLIVTYLTLLHYGRYSLKIKNKTSIYLENNCY